MKFTFFHLMPYPYLPDDFDDAFDSASLTFPNRYFDPKVGNRLYHQYLDELELAEQLGFDAIAINEHHQSAYGMMPSPNIMAAALARRTSRAQIQILGNAIGIREHPLRVAEEVAMLDHLSDGRLASGFVRGIGFEYFGHGVNPTRSRARFDEAHDLIVKAWTSEETFEWLSPNYHFRYVNIWPRPLQDPHPPIYIPGAGSTETMRFCAEHRYAYMSVYAPTRVVKSWFDGYRHAANDLGYEPEAEKIVFMIPLYVAETDELAREEAKQHILWLFHKGLKVPVELFFPPGYMSQGSMRGVLMSGQKGWGDLSYEEILDSSYALVGSADTIAQKIADLQDTLGFGALNVLMSIGDMPHEKTVKSMELFASSVMPALRGRQPQLALT
jgi:alkanesulfonate monooxygenase SsuD/methylene tetrahydromethanopterin reductase-like flavin-dependent oxidoreductase (luciferase family)